MIKKKYWNCDKNQKIKLWPNLKPQMVTKLWNSYWDKTKKNQMATKLNNPTCGQTKKLNYQQNSKLKLVKNQNNKFWQNSVSDRAKNNKVEKKN